MPVYDEHIPGDVASTVEEVISDEYPDLTEAEVTFSYLYAHGSKPGQPAVKLHGYPCAATIKINSLKDRAEGKKDVTITIDGDSWPDYSYEERVGLISHELMHLIVRRDKKGQIARDDRGRPKLKSRLHDWQIGGFAKVAKKHGEASFEVQHVRRLKERFADALQLAWEWGEERAGKGSGPGGGKRKSVIQVAQEEMPATVAMAGA